MTIPKHITPWRPDRPISKGATAYHDAVADSSWLKDIIHELSRIVNPHVKSGDLIVDFGAGTGTSAMYLLKNLKDKKFNLWLVDNSPSWLAKAYEILNGNPNVEYFMLGKKDGGYATLAETVGEHIADHIISANTVHLIPDIGEVFKGVSSTVKKNGTFTFQTGNFTRNGRPDGALVIDNTVQTVHDLSIETIKSDDKFAVYRNGLNERIREEEHQRKFVFPDPRPIELYIGALKAAGFKHEKTWFIPVRIKYDDWLNFLRVKRLQAGILPEVGGKDPTEQEEKDRDELITQSALKLFADLRKNNPLADDVYFTIECVYVLSKKI